jgi:uncharacterized protein YabE (DUF348 family)/3D (Asp-Asp-Asp) domain-containing protein
MFFTLVLGVLVLKSKIRYVTVIDGDKSVVYITFKKTIGDVLEKDFVLNAEDKIYYDNKEYSLKDGKAQSIKKEMIIKIFHAVPIFISCDGNRKRVLTTKKKVCDILNESMFFAYDRDLVVPGLNEIVEEDSEIVLTRINENIIYATEPIEYKINKKETNELEIGIAKVVQKGKCGTKELAYKIRYENGDEVLRKFIGEKVIEESVDEIIEIGKREKVNRFFASKTYCPERYFASSNGVLTSRDGSSLRYNKVLNCEATAYDSSYNSTGKRPDNPGYGVTASGERARYGVVAVDPRVIPLGTKLYIESLNGAWTYGLATALDTGGAIKGNKIDLYFDTEKEALKFGRKQARVFFLYQN